ncbi:MAG: DUF72 domain-containing protein [Myxococcales bacterium]
MKRAPAPKVVLPAPAPELYVEARALADQAPLPASSGNVHFGTAGWSDPFLSREALFYPKQVKTAEQRLAYYAEHFQLVEVDATYYALLAVETVARWVQWTPKGFQFDVKAHPVFTGHPMDRQRLPPEIVAAIPAQLASEQRLYAHALPRELTAELERRYFDSLSPLIDAGRLTSILVQFPPWFEATRGNARHLEQLRERYPSAPFSIEFRSRSWLAPERRDRVQALLRAQELAYVVVDEPDVERGGVPALPWVTSSRLAVLRFHGQNRRAWANPRATVAERFNYLYAPAELAAWSAQLRRMSGEAEQVHAVFNNCVRNYAILNAKGLAVLVSREG